MNGGNILIDPGGLPSSVIRALNDTTMAASVGVRSWWDVTLQVGWLPWVAGAAVVVVVWFIWRRIRSRPTMSTGRIRGHALPMQRLQAMTSDIDEELKILARVSKHRPLYPEEKYLRSKITQYRKILRSVLSGIQVKSVRTSRKSAVRNRS